MVRMGAGEGNRTLVFSLEVSGFSQCFQKPFRHFAAFWAIEITRDFFLVGMEVACPTLVLSEPFAGGHERTRTGILPPRAGHSQSRERTCPRSVRLRQNLAS